MKTYEQSINNLHKMYQQNNNLIIDKDSKELSKQIKLDIISLAYTDSLTAIDLQEAIDVLYVILHHKSNTNKRKDYK